MEEVIGSIPLGSTRFKFITDIERSCPLGMIPRVVTAWDQLLMAADNSERLAQRPMPNQQPLRRQKSGSSMRPLVPEGTTRRSTPMVPS
jgi:hypothetical protein